MHLYNTHRGITLAFIVVYASRREDMATIKNINITEPTITNVQLPLGLISFLTQRMLMPSLNAMPFQ